MSRGWISTTALVIASAGCLAAAPPPMQPAQPMAAPEVSCADLPFASCKQLASYARAEPQRLLLEIGPVISAQPVFEDALLDGVGGMTTSLDPVFAREWQRPF
ncbi:MAG: hypothetical protein KJO07_22235 [Deltaproteobacteria bacterium]|jgi:hypothetical protein|nr:hypothetical protein [Deltaproteobacteria bacterium]